MKRSRGRGRRSGGGHNNNPNKHFESNGPGVKIRGSAQQILDKYQQYARDAQSSGDRVDAENYLQHAEHYYRVLAKMKPPEKPKQEPREGDAKDEQNTGAETNEAKSVDGEGQKSDESRENRRGRGRGRNRRDRYDGDAGEPARSETQSKDEAGEAEPASGDTDTAQAEKPAMEDKPKRRRTYKKREPAAAKDEALPEMDAGDDGVMKTLSRGRKKAAPKAEANAEASEAPPEAD